MYREIKKKLLILENRKPWKPEIASYIEELHKVDWIYTDLKLDGSVMTRDLVERVVKGDFIAEASIQDHANIANHLNLFQRVRTMLEMGTELKEKYILRFYEDLVQPAAVQYRQNNPILFMLDNNPPHFHEMEDQMEVLVQWLHSPDPDLNPIQKAALLHNKIIEIYPFEQGSEMVARAAMYYQLLQSGYPVFSLDLSEQAYYDALRAYLKKEDLRPMYEAVLRGIYTKLEVMMQLTAWD